MRVKDLLHYQNPSITPQYGLTVTNNPNIDRLLSGLPAWEKPEGLVLKKKTLIVNACDLSTLTSDTHEIIIKERLEVLAQQGFDLYVFSNNELHHWNDIKRSHIENDAQQFQMSQAVQKLGLSVDELLILDKTMLIQLIKGDSEDWEPYKDATEIILHQSNLSVDSLTELLLARQEEIIALTLSECINLKGYRPPSELSVPKLRKLIFKNNNSSSRRLFTTSELPQDLMHDFIHAFIGLAPVLSELDLDSFQGLEEDILDKIINPTTLKELRLRNSPINPDSLKKTLCAMSQIKALNLIGHKNLSSIITAQLKVAEIEELFLDDPDVNDETLGILLEQPSKLKVLVLNNSKGITMWGRLANRLVLLERLELARSNISIKALAQLIKQATHLKSLHLSFCTNLKGSIDEELNLSSLETLKLNSSNISIEALVQLIKKATHLKSLHLSGSTNLEGSIDEELNLSSLETIVLSHSNISIKSLAQLIKQATHLKSLHLSGCTNLEGSIDEQLHLSSLEALKLNRSNISIEALAQLIKQATHLKSLDLFGCKKLDGLIDEELNLSSLETLDLSYSNISTEALAQIIKQATRLQSLNLSGCTNLKGSIDEELNLSSLVTLKLSDSNISIALAQLIKQATHLKSLHLSSCTNLEGLIDEELNLSSLDTLDLSHSNISTEALAQLIKQATRLQSLNLFDCTNLEGSIVKELNLSSLETIVLSNSNISIKALAQLVKRATHLRSLDLSGCGDLEGSIDVELNLSSLETIVLSNSNISIKALAQLIKQATHLKSLDLSGCGDLEDSIDVELNLSSLETLDLSHSNISTEALAQLIKQATHLKSLHLSGCTYLDKKSIARIIAQRPDLTVVGLKTLRANAASTELHHNPMELPSNPQLAPANKSPNPTQASSGNAGVCATVDADTQPDPKKTLTAQTMFYSKSKTQVPPPVSTYRLITYNTLTLEPGACTIQNAFTLGSKEDLMLTRATTQESRSDTWHLQCTEDCFYGKQYLSLSTQWQPLASLAAGERMIHYHLSGEISHEIGYSERDNLYYIRLTAPLAVDEKAPTIDFLVQQPQSKPSENRLHEDIQNKINACRAFKARALQGLSATATAGDYMAALEAQQVGACRHRVLVFMHWMQQNHPNVRVRTVFNDVHAFIELYDNNQWQRIDLGGYSGTLDLTEPCPPPGTTPEASPRRVQLNRTGARHHSYFPMPRPEPEAPSCMEYMHRLLASGHKKILLDLRESDINAVRRVIQQAQGQKPCWYIHSPEDLITSAPFIKRVLQADGRYTGELHKGPGGAFYEFLKKHEHDAPLIIVNYSEFSPADIVRFNALLDEIREADGTALPQNAIVLGLTDFSKPETYDGTDFLSRFDRAPIKCPFGTAQLPTPIEIQQQGQIRAHCVIDLLGSSHWEEQLLGSWSLSGQDLTFVPGALIKALTSTPPATHVELRNAPWDNKDFDRFWQDTLSSNILHSRYDTLRLPEGFSITKSQGYDWAVLTQRLQPALEPVLTPAHHILNPSTLSRFLGAYSCDNETHTVRRSEGLLREHREQDLPVYLSAPLSDADWAKLLTECAANQVTLNLHKAPGLPLPKAWSAHPIIPESPLSEPASWRTCAQNQDCIVQSTDKDLTRKQLNAAEVLEIDVSELDSEHLLTQIQASFDKEQLRFSFTQSEGALLCALRENKSVVLHGIIKPTLWDALNQLMIERQQNPSPNQGVLIVLGTPPYPQTHLPLFEHHVSLAEHAAALSTEGFNLASQEDKPYTQLRAEAAHKLRASNSPNSTPWQGIHTLPPEQLPIGPVDLSEPAAEAMNIQRMSAVTEALDNAPFVLLSGKTGVGKSSFIPQWRQAHPALHIGESALIAWAKDERQGIKTLFIDEANISGSDWSIFEGLFNKNPGVVIDNIYYPLSKNHKVIFAANPMSYGGERRLPALFERHGNSVIFEPMSPAFLYHNVLAPLLNNQKEWAIPLLNIAQFFASCSPNAVLISPRELEMMALLAMSYCKRTPDANPLEVVSYYAYTLAKNLVPQEKSAEFEALFQTNELPRVQPKTKRICLTQSNQPAYQALNDLIELRKARISREMPSTGGLGGLIIEGEPGVGKSELVMDTLLAQGLTQGNNQHAHPNENVFYRLPASYTCEQKRALFLKAFHEGAVVVMDECNSSHGMERLLNELLMGTFEGKPAAKAGFMIIGSQNPISMAGRKRSSNALQRRTQKVIIPEYSHEEMSSILQAKGLNRAQAEELIDAYNLAKTPQKLCLRDLVERAKELVTARQRSKAHDAGLGFFEDSGNAGGISPCEGKMPCPPMRHS